MLIISDTNMFATLVEAIKLRVLHAEVEMEGDGAASITVGQRVLIKVRDFGRSINCYRHPLCPASRGYEAVREAHELVRAALADLAINMLKVAVR